VEISWALVAVMCMWVSDQSGIKACCLVSKLQPQSRHHNIASHKRPNL